MGLLKKINLVRSASKAEKIFEELFFDKTFLDIDYTSPEEMTHSFDIYGAISRI